MRVRGPCVAGQARGGIGACRPSACRPRLASLARCHAGVSQSGLVPAFGNPYLNVPGRDAGDVVASKYTIQARLGHGSNGITYSATAADGKPVAVKELSLDRMQNWKQFDLFEREAKVLASLEHPCIPRYLDHAAADGSYFLVQQLAQGRTLQEMVDAGLRFTDDDVTALATQLLDVLSFLQAQRPPVVHRDIKPENLLISGGVPGGRVLVIDFGGVVTSQAAPIFGSTIIGTYGYMAPEQFRGAAVPASDAYSVGAVLLFLLSGKPPHAFHVERLRLNLDGALAHCPHRLQWLVEGLLEPLEEDRLTVSQAMLMLKGSAAVVHRLQRDRLARGLGGSWSSGSGSLSRGDIASPGRANAPMDEHERAARDTAHSSFSRDALLDHPGLHSTAATFWPTMGDRYAASIGAAPMMPWERNADATGTAPRERGSEGGKDAGSASDDEGPDLPNPFEYGWPRSKRTIRLQDLNAYLGRGESKRRAADSSQLCRPWREAPRTQPLGSRVTVHLEGDALTVEIPALGADDETCAKAAFATMARCGVALAAASCAVLGGPFAGLLVAPFAMVERSNRPYISVAGYSTSRLSLNPELWLLQQLVPKLANGRPLFDNLRDVHEGGATVGLRGARVVRAHDQSGTWKPSTVVELLAANQSVCFGEGLSTLEQEWIVGRINGHLESIGFEGAVDVENE